MSIVSDPDADILMRIARGEQAAAGDAIDRFGPLVLMLARKLLIDQSQVEDAVQEVFTEVWRCAGRFDPSVASARAFVAIIARRRIIDRGRSEQVRVKCVVGLEVVGAAAPTQTIDEQAREVSAALANLAPDQQEAIRLSIGRGWTHQRVAEHLAQPLGTVKSNIRRGLARLRELIEPTSESPTKVNA